MSLIAFGINHNTAPVELREKVAFSPEQVMEALSALKTDMGIRESVILSTCNRTEIYVHGDQLDGDSVSHWLASYHKVDPAQLASNSYRHGDTQAVQHLMRVACGLDSLVLGEPQILGQIKQAYTSAKHAGNISGDFERLFQQTFAVAKKVRSETDIGANAVSVAFASVQLAKHIFSSLSKTRVLLIGAGETIELVARHLNEQGVAKMTVANRTLARAEAIAASFNGDVITLAQIPHHLHEADIVISSTASQLPILGKGMVERALKQRRHQPIFLVDLAVPRDIEGEVGELDDAYLYTVDDLQQIVEKNVANRQNAAQEAEQLVLEHAQSYVQWRQAQHNIDVLKEYRQQNLALREQLQTRALNQLADGKAPEEVVVELANKLTNRLMHAPTRALKQAAESQDDAQLALLIDALGIDLSNTEN